MIALCYKRKGLSYLSPMTFSSSNLHRLLEFLLPGLKEEIKLDISLGDIVLGGKWKNKRMVVKSIGKDDLGQPTVNGKNLLTMRIEKDLPPEKQSKETRDNKEGSSK